MTTIPTVSIYGISVSKMGMQDTVRYLTEAIEQHRPHQVITANPIMVMAALENPDYMAMMRRAELVIPDGAGLVWAAGFVGNPVAERVPGIDLVHQLLKVGEKHRWKVYLLGAEEEVVRKATDRISELYPNISIVGYRNGFFDESEDAEVVQHIKEAAPHILLVARQTSNQEPWIGKYKHELNVPVMMGVGGTFDVLAGKVKRAPKLFQRLRLEWFYRLLSEPRRYKRMLALPKFAAKVIREKENVQKYGKVT